MIRPICLLLCLLLATNSGLANGLRVTEVASDGQEVTVTVAWENAWELTTGPANHDAVWLFMKIQRQGAWEHLRLDTAASAHSAETAGRLQLIPDPQGLGIMLRNTTGTSGAMPETRLHLRMASPILAGTFKVAVMGIEMAWVNAGPYWLGDGASNGTLRDSATGMPYLVGDESAIAAATLSAAGADKPGGDIPAAFPKGHDGFYLMKYEISQEQYADFLNLLTPTQRAARMDAAHWGSNRNGLRALPAESVFVVCDANAGVEVNGANDGQSRACNWLSWDDLAAYLDWAALRPMTELEYEKACRGPLGPTALEFAWGTDSVVDANTVLLDGTSDEGVAEVGSGQAGLASHGYAGPQGPLRCGFAAGAATDRVAAGAGYYGHMELSGNLWELCVSTGSAGLGFAGEWGDGQLDDSGRANVTTWPGAAGVGYRGGGWNSGVIPGFRDLAVSDRFYIGLASDARRATTGGRGAR